MSDIIAAVARFDTNGHCQGERAGMAAGGGRNSDARDNDAGQARYNQSETVTTLLSPTTFPPADHETAIGWRGRLLHIHITPAKSLKMQELEHANLVAGRGIEGDRYFLGTGTYSVKPDVRDVTLFEIEVLEALARNDPPIQAGPITIEPGEHRRNLTVRGVPLGHLVGKRFRVGEVVLKGGRLNFPCKYLEKLLERPVYLPIYNRSGLNCRIEQGGTIHRGDVIEPLDD